jgi:hypothetical protein
LNRDRKEQNMSNTINTPQPASTICGRCGGDLPLPPGKPRAKPDRLGLELHRQAGYLMEAAERVDLLGADPRLHAQVGARLALKLSKLNLALLAAAHEAEENVDLDAAKESAR